MEAQRKNLIYKALAVTFAIMFLSLFFAEIIYERKANKFEEEMSYLSSTIKEGQLILTLRDVMKTKMYPVDDAITDDGLAERVYQTGVHIEQLSADEDREALFKKVSREWVYINIELLAKLIQYNRVAHKKKDYILYLYPPDCGECISYKTLFGKLHKVYGEDVWLFIIPDNSESGVLNTLKRHYGFKKLPAVVVNGRAVRGEEVLQRIEKLFPRINPPKEKMEKEKAKDKKKSIKKNTKPKKG